MIKEDFVAAPVCGLFICIFRVSRMEMAKEGREERAFFEENTVDSKVIERGTLNKSF